MRDLDRPDDVRAVVLVEGASDASAVHALARRYERDLAAERVLVVPMGGATSVGRFVERWGPAGRDVRLAGLYDVAEERWFARALERAGVGTDIRADELAALGFGRCVADLEDELIRALGADAVIDALAAVGELRAFRTLQRQPAQQGRTVEAQLRRFMGTRSGRKESAARVLVDALDLDRVPPPLRLVFDAL